MNFILELFTRLTEENVKLKQILGKNFISECKICLSFSRSDDWRNCLSCACEYCVNCIKTCGDCGHYYCDACFQKKCDVNDHDFHCHLSKCYVVITGAAIWTDAKLVVSLSVMIVWFSVMIVKRQCVKIV